MLERFKGLAGGDRLPPADTLLLITGAVAELLPVILITAEFVSAGGADYPREGLHEFIQPQGGRVFVAHADLPARIEAEEVTKIRRSAFMGALYGDYGPDANRIPLPFWVLLGVLVLFVGIAAIRH
jgi:hypothetical protein